MNRNRTKNFIFYLIEILVILAVVSIVVTVVIPLVSDDYQKITAIATAILAGIALFTYPYAKKQLDSMRTNNDATHIKAIFNLEEKMSEFELRIRTLRKDFQTNAKLEDKKNKIKEEHEVNLIIYYNRLENLCFYILHFQKSLQNNDLFKNMKEMYSSHLERIYEIEGENFKKNDFSKKHPFIPKLFRDWEIWKP
ncbi:hypothetical protein COTS27_01322 [Spirochaetota bacterium]|nr:hypothetical protein COTS27_01322 [Spirochaetota bacterium]